MGCQNKAKIAQAPNCAQNKKEGILCTYLDGNPGENVKLFPGMWWGGLELVMRTGREDVDIDIDLEIFWVNRRCGKAIPRIRVTRQEET
jgi:hypothetical protein